METAVIYTRVSTHSQEDGTSLAAQANACYEMAKSLDLEVTEYIEETMSGGLYMARTGLQRALELIESGKASVLITYRLDRTGRNLDGLRDVKKRVEMVGGKLVFADGISFEKNAIGNFMFTQLGAVAELEREMIRDRCMKGLRETAAKGIQPSRSYSPLGYYIVKKNDVLRGQYTKDQEGKYIIIPDQAELVEKIFNKYIELRSLRGVIGWLFNQDIPSQKGHSHWLPCTIRQILMNPVYKGLGTYGRGKHRLDEKRLAENLNIRFRKNAPESDWVTFETPAIITEEIWENANSTLISGRDNRSGRSRYMLTGMVMCPDCHSRMYAIKIRNATEGVRSYGLGCSRVYPFKAPWATLGEPACKRTRYNGRILESMLMDALNYLFSQPEIIQKAFDKYTKAQKAKPKLPSVASEIRTLKSTIENARKMEIQAARSVIIAQVNGGDGSAYESIRQESEKKRLHADARLLELKEQNTEPKPFQINTDGWKEFQQAVFAGNISDAECGTLLEQFIDIIYPLPHPTRANYATGGLEVYFKTNMPNAKLVLSSIKDGHGKPAKMSLEVRPNLT